jgi:hypothetical protein
MNSTGPLTYDFSAKRQRNGILITGHIGGKRTGVPHLGAATLSCAL